MAFQAINEATWAYKCAGFTPLFMGAILSLLRKHHENPFRPTYNEIEKFLAKFYNVVQENLIDATLNHHFGLLFVTTMLSILNVSNAYNNFYYT